MNAKRDWGHAKDYVEAMWLILQQKTPDDFVISTGTQYSVFSFIKEAALNLNMKIFWKGKGINTKGYNEKNQIIIECSKKYFRPAEVETLLGDCSKARKTLKWKPRISFKKLVKEMTLSDYNLVKLAQKK